MPPWGGANLGMQSRRNLGKRVTAGRPLQVYALFDACTRVEDFGQQGSKIVVVDQPPGDANALVEPHQVRAGEGVDFMARRLERGTQKGDRRAFAVGARDVEDRREPVLRPVQPLQQFQNAVEPEAIARRR